VRIGFVSEHASPLAALGGVDAGGQNVHVAELAAALVRLGHQVTVYTRRDARDLPARVTVPDGYDVRHLDAGPAEPIAKDDLWPLMPAFAAGLADDLGQRPLDVVHAHFWMSGWAAVQAARVRSQRILLTFHALGHVKRRYQGRADPSPEVRLDVERQIAHDVNRIIATCTDELGELAGLGVPAERISVVPCGVDLSQFTPIGPRLLAPSRRMRMLCVGRLVPRKGYDIVIETLPQLDNLELVIAGGDPNDEAERNRLEELAERLGVSNRVTLLGQVSRGEMPGLMRSADVVVCTPWYEPFGIVPVEAMACGVPVVASAVGGMLDTVVHHVTGLLVPPRDPGALASALRRLSHSPELRARLGQEGAARARRHYSWATVAEQTARIYADVLAEPEAGSSTLLTTGAS
jgi:D-inositol-3-phosphate glycosyltransferase